MPVISTKSDGNYPERLPAVSLKQVTGTVAGTGSTQGDAGALALGFNLVSGADGTVGVRLPAATAGLSCRVKNNVGSVLKVYPPSGGKINALATNTALSQASSAAAEYVCYDGTSWYTIPLLPS